MSTVLLSKADDTVVSALSDVAGASKSPGLSESEGSTECTTDGRHVFLKPVSYV